MKIAFYLKHCGMGNNGGTRTIVKSCEALNKLGHDAYIVADVDRYTWDKHQALEPYVKKGTHEVIACSIGDAECLAKNFINGVWWLNSWKSDNMLSVAKSIKCITNSMWLSDMLKRNGVKAPVCHAGLDKWTDLKWRGKRTTIGFLYNQHHKTKWKHIPELINMFPEYDFIGYGDCERPDFNCRYIRRPSHMQKQQIYSQCHIWVASTESEGFHNVGAEAGSCGCLVMCNRLDSNGMSYASERTADRFDSFAELVGNVKSPNYDKVRFMKRALNDNVGTRERCMKRFVEVLRGY